VLSSLNESLIISFAMSMSEYFAKSLSQQVSSHLINSKLPTSGPVAQSLTIIDLSSALYGPFSPRASVRLLPTLHRLFSRYYDTSTFEAYVMGSRTSANRSERVSRSFMSSSASIREILGNRSSTEILVKRVGSARRYFT